MRAHDQQELVPFSIALAPVFLFSPSTPALRHFNYLLESIISQGREKAKPGAL